MGDLGHGSALRLTAAIAADPCHTEVAPRSLARSVTSTVRPSFEFANHEVRDRVCAQACNIRATSIQLVSD